MSKTILVTLPTWFLRKNNLSAKCSSDRRDGHGFVTKDKFVVMKETDKAYYLDINVWCPKSVVESTEIISELDLDELNNKIEELEQEYNKLKEEYKANKCEELENKKDELFNQLMTYRNKKLLLINKL